MNEERNNGYQDLYQAGWNAAMDDKAAPQAQQPAWEYEMTNHNNPPAFPTTHNGSTLPSMSGLTMLDHFAGLAMQGLLASEVNAPADEFARRSYTMAGALLKERQKWIK